MTRIAARRPVAMLVHGYYEEDARVRRQAELLVGRGRPVHVYSLRRRGDASEASLDGVMVHRLDVQRHQGARLATYLAEYVAFLARSAWALARDARRRYALVVVHSIPDFLAFAAVPEKLAGVPLLLDLHEAMPEFFRSRFAGRLSRRASGVAYGLLRAQERAAVAMADHVITVNDALGDRLLGLGLPAGRLTIVPNSPSLRRFDPRAHPRREFAADGTVRLVYAGGLSPIYEIEVAIDALARLRALRPDLPVALEIYGREFGEVPLKERVAAASLEDRVTFHGRIPLDDVPAAVAAADIGLAPTRRTDFTDFSLSTKVLEYGAMGKPVVASRLPLVERTFAPDTVLTYEPGSADDLAAAILRLVDDAAERDARVARTAERVRELAWEVTGERYVALVERLARDGLSSAGAGGAAPGRNTVTNRESG